METKTLRKFNLAKKIIPGGTQLFSKKPELFAPGAWPGYYSKAKGVNIWDLDNKKYYIYSSSHSKYFEYCIKKY